VAPAAAGAAMTTSGDGSDLVISAHLHAKVPTIRLRTSIDLARVHHTKSSP
jgi:hypothetical protein